MGTKVPYRRITSEFERAKKNNEWRRVGQVIDRNFEEIERVVNVERTIEDYITTVDASPLVITTIDLDGSATVMLDILVVARRTGGSAGAAEDGAAYRRYAAFKNVGGTATQIGSTSSPFTAEDQAGWNVSLSTSSGNVYISVTGAANNDITWHAVTKVLSAST